MPQADIYTYTILVIAIICANLTWLSDKLLFIINLAHGKHFGFRLLEWLLLYLLTGLIAYGLEQRLFGNLHSQQWEFYVITFCLFIVFALPGFIYKTQLKPLLSKRSK